MSDLGPTLLLGDCLERMVEIPDGSIDLILTSPPYGDLRGYEAGSEFDFEGVAAHCMRVLCPGGVLVWIVGDETKGGSESGASFRQALHFKSLGLRLHDTMIYRKSNPMPLPRHRRYTPAFEFMFVLTKGSPKTVNLIEMPCKQAGRVNPRTCWKETEGKSVLVPMNGTRRPYRETKPLTNIWTYTIGGCNNNFQHPAIFPLELAHDHIATWTNPGDTVLDPFVGSGTTLVACILGGRIGIGIDKSESYLKTARRRIVEAKANLGSLLPLG
jgi:DNA modification methylase